MDTTLITFEARTIQQLLRHWDALYQEAHRHVDGEALKAFEESLRLLREQVEGLPPEPKVAVMLVTKCGTTSMIGNAWVDDYHVVTFAVEDTHWMARQKALKARLPIGLWWCAPFDETRWNIPHRVMDRCTQQGLHII